MASMAYGIPIDLLNPPSMNPFNPFTYIIETEPDLLGPGLDLGTAFSFAPSTAAILSPLMQFSMGALDVESMKLTPTVCVFPGGLACLAVVYFHTTRTSRSFCLSDLSLALLADLLGHKIYIYIYIHLQHDEWPVAASEQWPVTTDHSIE